MNNEDVRRRRVKLLIRDLNVQIDRAFEQGVAVNIGLVDKTKIRDKSHRYHVELKGENDHN
jgi:hypothetical protein